MQRVYFLGVDPATGKEHDPPTGLGSFEWRKVLGQAVTPDWAKRTAVFLGLAPATGNVSFDSIHLKVE